MNLIRRGYMRVQIYPGAVAPHIYDMYIDSDICLYYNACENQFMIGDTSGSMIRSAGCSFEDAISSLMEYMESLDD